MSMAGTEWRYTRHEPIFQSIVIRMRKMVIFKLGKEMKKDVFRLVTSVGQRKNSESPRGIEPQTYGFRAPDVPPLSHRDSMVSMAYYVVNI